MADKDSTPRPSPSERRDEFARENENWDRKIQESLRELDESIEKPPHESVRH